MLGGLFKGLRSNRPINSAHPPSVQAQDTLKQLQKLNQQNARTVAKTPDFNDKNREMLKRQAEMMKRNGQRL